MPLNNLINNLVNNLKIRRSGLFVLILFSLSCVLTACDQHKNTDIHTTLEKIRQTVPEDTIKKPALPLVTAQVYEGAARRSPFSDLDAQATQKKQAEGATPLEKFSISDLKFIGTIEQKGARLAVILLPTGEVVEATIGTAIGRQAGKINAIQEDTVNIVQGDIQEDIVNTIQGDGAGRDGKKITAHRVTMHLVG